jgi:hypothetical protein
MRVPANDTGLRDDMIEISSHMLSDGDIVKEIYGEKLYANNINQFATKAILSPLNAEVDGMNQKVLDILEGDSISYRSIDSVKDEEGVDATHYPVEFLNTLTPSGMPPHTLTLKVGAIIMMLRNFKGGLCNGTRMIVKDLKPNVIIAEIDLNWVI